MIRADVIIVGGGPAGAACARRLKKGGAKVLVLEKQKFPRLKPCAGWVTPRVWQKLGIPPSEYPFGLTEFAGLDIMLWNLHFTLHTRQYAIRRIEFDDWLLKLSEVSIHQHQVNEIKETKDGFTVDGKFSTKYLVGAGGTSCPVRRTFFSSNRGKHHGSVIAALEEEFMYETSDRKCRLWFFQDHLPGYSWLVPKVNGWVNVGVGAMADTLNQKGERLQDHWQRFVEKLEQDGLVKGHTYNPLGYSYRLRSKQSEIQIGNIFLIGDSAGLATRDMGEGIGPAIESGFLAAEAILQGTKYNVRSILSYSFPPMAIIRTMLIRNSDPRSST
jgi:menaquinone-9 beta-reductase